jgi:sensor domain CHASE-containing protein
MIVLYAVFAIFFYCIWELYLLVNNRHSSQVHKENQRLNQEIKRLQSELDKVKRKNYNSH